MSSMSICLSNGNVVVPEKRFRMIHLFQQMCKFNLSDAREMEATIHASSLSDEGYTDKIQQIIHNVNSHPKLYSLKNQIVCMTNSELSQGTLIENIENEARQRQQRFEAMLQNKYEQTNDTSCKSTLKCRRCGSSEVQVEQKQTRGADEAMTVFCTCSVCSNRWTMR